MQRGWHGTQWEYLYLSGIGQRGETPATIDQAKLTRYTESEAMLNAQGRDGWELVAVDLGTSLIFKCPKPTA